MSCHVAILGGGCAGLSLATALVRGNFHGRITVIEPREAYQDDRTWSYWGVAPHPFEHLACRSWSRWRVRTQSGETQATCDEFPYHCIRSGDYYRETLELLKSAPMCDLQFGVAAHAVTPAGGLQVVHTSRGELVADHVFDSRPAPAVDGLRQHFEGWLVETRNPVFDPEVVTLMDFAVDQSLGIHFFYVLPMSPTKALVEATFMTPEAFHGDAYAPMIRAYLDRIGAAEARVVARERGVIPMSLTRPEADRPGYTRIGVAGGMIRNATGYAFLTIQQSSQELARRIIDGRPIPAKPPQGGALRWLDRVFLRVLTSRPDLAPKIFLSLFQKCQPDQLVNFLHRPRRPGDWLGPITSVPAIPFLSAAWQDVSATL